MACTGNPGKSYRNIKSYFTSLSHEFTLVGNMTNCKLHPFVIDWTEEEITLHIIESIFANITRTRKGGCGHRYNGNMGHNGIIVSAYDKTIGK